MKKKKSQKTTLQWVMIGLIVFAFVIGIKLLDPTDSDRKTFDSTQEIRGVWITNVNSGILFVPWAINKALNQLSQLHFNTVYPVVWNRGTTFYKSTVAKRVTGRFQDDLLNFMRLGGDILSEIVREGHQNGLRIIPWFEYGFMAPIDSNVVRYHPDWVTLPKSESLKPISSQTDLLREVAANTPFFGIRNVWLNPLNPRVQRFIQDLILEVVIKYDVDGIQLDDHFAMPVELGYDWYTVKLYRQEHQGKMPPDDPYNSEWIRWRADKITRFMNSLVQEIKTVKPHCLISLSPHPKNVAYRDYLQDWETWVNQGLIGELVVQVYRENQHSFQAELDHPSIQKIRQKIPVSIGILTGLFGKTVEISTVQAQVQAVRDRGFNGISFFYWESLWSYLTPNSPKQRRRVFQELLSVSSKKS